MMRWLVVAVAACGGSHATLRGAADDGDTRPDGHGAHLALPPRGDAASAVLPDGWPVWIVHHADGSASVTSAVAPPHEGAGSTVFAGPASLVRWQPRVFVAGDIAYDEYGRLLGYAVECSTDCPRIVEAAFDERDLDGFAATIDGDRVIVGAFQPSPPRPYVSRWADYDRPNRQERELELATARWPGTPVAIARAMQQPVGSYSLVTGSLVQSTTDPPQLCEAQRCVAALGVAPIAVSQAATHAAPATMLVRRARRGLVVVAASRFDR